MHLMHLILVFYIFLLLDTKNPDFSPYKQPIINTNDGISLAPVTGGSFLMGNDDPDHPNESPVHKVTVGDFWIGQYEITWPQYEAFVFNKAEIPIGEDLRELGIDGLSGATTPYTDMSFGMGKDGFPAVNMTQYGAQMFCKWLSAQSGIFYRLPTEAEWEYACRAGAKSTYYFDQEELRQYAFFQENAAGGYKKVGRLKPNAFELYDMLGNVAEWTLDQYSKEFYSNSVGANDPWLEPLKLYPRTVRGGSWKEAAGDCQCTSRKPSKANWKLRDPQFPKSRWWHTNAPFVGFRIVRPRETPPREEIKKFWLEPMDDYN